MVRLFFEGGIYMWPILILAIVNAVLTIKKVYELFVLKDLPRARLEGGLNAIFFWGGICVILGYISHYHGMFMAMVDIAEANDISPAIVAGGYKVSLITILFGLLVFMFSAIAWFFLRWRYKTLVAATE